MKNKCESCDDECKNIAKWECELCGTRYCDECASNSDYTCDCEEPPHLIKIKKAKKSTKGIIADKSKSAKVDNTKK